jgi:hypothetical protein
MKSRRITLLALTFVLILSAFVTMPAAANPGWQCEDGCWDWNSTDGCTQEVTCCARDDGAWFCILW